jgi:predicted nucleic acid-binding protein
MADVGAPQLEHLVCDTTVVSLLFAATKKPGRIAHWPLAQRERLTRSLLAMSVITLGELRAGYKEANWGEPKIAEAERAVSAYLQVPLDPEVLAKYVDLRAVYRRQMNDNDLWIAATAMARGWPLVACDLDFCKLRSDLDLIYLPSAKDSPAECPERS